MTTSRKKVLSKCKGCGGNLLFSPSSQDLVCEKCLGHVSLEKSRKFCTHDYEKGKNCDDNQKWLQEEHMFHCKSCGGQVSLCGAEISQICPYCGSAYVCEIESLLGLKPDCVIPFSFDKTSALQIFKQKVAKMKFLPNQFKKSLPESKIYGLYIPCFSFDADVLASYKGVLEEDYHVSDREGGVERKTRSFPIFGTIELQMRDVLVEASQKMTPYELQAISPYRREQSVKFDEGFLRGFYVEHYTDSLDVSREKALDMMENNVKKNILSQYNYDRVRYLDIDSKYSNEKYIYTLVPVYKFEYTYKKKRYLTCMNGQTGKVQGNLPKSGWKIFGLVGGIIAVIALIIIILNLVF